MAASTGRTIPELLHATSADASSIFSDISTLAKAETSDSAKKIGAGLGFIVAALGLAWFALVALTIAFGFGLVALGLPIWAAFLIVTAVFVLLAAGLIFAAIRLFKRVSAPRRTMAALKGTFDAFVGPLPDEASGSEEPAF